MHLLSVFVLCWLAAASATALATLPPDHLRQGYGGQEGGSDRMGSQSDEAAVRAVVARYVEAREKRDAKLLEALFTADADQLVTTGEWRRGRDHVVRGGLASSQANPGARQIAIEVVRFVAPGVAIADGRYEIAEGQGAPPRRMRTTFVTVRNAAGEWRIAAIRNMAPTDPAR
jgi:uncharacterized protein (TIGR02246 family)